MKLSEVFGQIPEAAPLPGNLSADEASYLHYVLSTLAGGDSDAPLWQLADEVGLDIDIDKLRNTLYRIGKASINKGMS